jgi:hypothetical protein
MFEPGSSVSGYGLDDRAIEVRSSAEAEGFFPLAPVRRPALGPTQPPIQEATPGPFPGLKRGRNVKLITRPHLVPRSRMSMNYTSSPPKRLRGVQCFSFIFTFALIYILCEATMQRQS